MENEIIVSSLEWKELQNTPAFKVFLSTIMERLEIKRDSLEAGIESMSTADGDHIVVTPYEDIRFVQGECKSLRYIEILLTNKERLTKEAEKIQEERKKDGTSKK